MTGVEEVVVEEVVAEEVVEGVEEEEEGWAVGGGAGDLEILLGFCEGLGSECTPAELVLTEGVLEAGEAPPEVR